MEPIYHKTTTLAKDANAGDLGARRMRGRGGGNHHKQQQAGCGWVTGRCAVSHTPSDALSTSSLERLIRSGREKRWHHSNSTAISGGRVCGKMFHQRCVVLRVVAVRALRHQHRYSLLRERSLLYYFVNVWICCPPDSVLRNIRLLFANDSTQMDNL